MMQWLWHGIRFHRLQRLPAWAHFKWRCATCRQCYKPRREVGA